MRIGVYDPYLDDIGGGEKYMMTIASLLSENNNVDVFWDHPEDLALVSKRFGLDTTKIHLVQNVFNKGTSLLVRFFKTLPYDIIIFLSDGSIPLVGARKLYIHIQQPLEYMQPGVLGAIKRSRVTKFFCNSKYTQQFVSQKFHIPMEILYPPVKLSPKPVKKENIILHVGRFRVKNVSNGDYKKQSIMIEAFKKLIDGGLTNWKFVLAISFSENETSQFHEMEKKTKGYPIEFLINKSNSELWDIYSKAKIYWHASGYGEDLKRHPEFAEHFGISTVEAMGAGAVPAVINAGGQKEIVTDKENGFLWDTIDQLCQTTLTLTKDEELREKMAKKAVVAAGRFADTTFAQKLNALIA